MALKLSIDATGELHSIIGNSVSVAVTGEDGDYACLSLDSLTRDQFADLHEWLAAGYRSNNFTQVRVISEYVGLPYYSEATECMIIPVHKCTVERA
jgi:hypothetical protein